MFVKCRACGEIMDTYLVGSHDKICKASKKEKDRVCVCYYSEYR